MLNADIDVFSGALVFLEAHEVCALRLVSRAWQRIVDCDATWARWVQEQLCVSWLVPQPRMQIAGCAWKRFVQHTALHRLATPSIHRSAADAADSLNRLSQFGKWNAIATSDSSADDRTATITINDNVVRFFEAVTQPTPFSRTIQTSTVGVIVVAQDWALRESQTMLHEVQQQALDFLHVATPNSQTMIAPLLSADPRVSLHIFGAAPIVGNMRRMVLVLRVAKNDVHPDAVAQLTQLMFSVCSSVQFVAQRAEGLARFCALYGSQMPTVPAAPFSTAANTPSVVFTTNHGAVQPELSDVMDVEDATEHLHSWIFNRTCSVGVAQLRHKNLFSLAKPLQCPAWENAATTIAVSPAAVAMMIKSFVLHRAVWTVDVMKVICLAEERMSHQFYEQAIRTEFEDHTRPLSEDRVIMMQQSSPQAFADDENSTSTMMNNNSSHSTTPSVALFHSTPMSPLAMVEAHNLYFYATLRKYAHHLPAVCGRDSDAGMKLLEVLKRNISDTFRTFWRKNNDYSRDYCNSLFEHIFSTIEQKFYTYDDPSASALVERRGLKHWYTLVRDLIHEYELKAKGLRQYDILSEELSTNVFPHLCHFVEEHAALLAEAGATFKLEDARHAVDDVTALVHQRTVEYSRETDGALHRAQHESALYTAAMSNELAAQFSKIAGDTLRRNEEDAEAWEQACLFRIRMLSAKQRRAGAMTPASRTTGGLAGASGDDVGMSSEDGSVVMRLDDTLSTESETTHVDMDDLSMEADDVVLSRCAEHRGQLLHDTHTAERDLKAAADRLSARLEDSQHSRNFDVLQRAKNSGRSTFSRLKAALRSALR